MPSLFALGHPLIGNEDLKPEQSLNTEFRVEREFLNDSSFVSASLYHTKYRDLIDFDPELFTNVNRNDITIRGVNVAVTLQLNDNVTINGSVSTIDIDSLEVSDIPFRVNDTRVVYDAPRPRRDVAPPRFRTSMARNAEVSPDGRRLVFETAGRLYIKDLPDGQTRLLTRDDNDHFEYDPTWSRDGLQRAERESLAEP